MHLFEAIVDANWRAARAEKSPAMESALAKFGAGKVITIY